MLKCNKVYESELCIQGERILNKQQQSVTVSRREQPTIRKTLRPNVVTSFGEQAVCGDLLKINRKVEDFKRLLQTSAEVNNDVIKYAEIYYEFFGVYYEHLKSLSVEWKQIRIEYSAFFASIAL